MIKVFFPNEYVSSVYKINLDRLIDKGIKGILFDIDNTLVPYNIEQPPIEVINFLNKVQKKGLKVILISNNTEDRIVKFNEQLQLFAIHKAKKPRRINIQKAVNIMELRTEEVAIVGDQVFTDVFGGNLTQIYTILVKPISDVHDEWITKIKRGAERKIIKKYISHRKKNN